MPVVPRVIPRNKVQVRQFGTAYNSDPSLFALSDVLGGIANVGEPLNIPVLAVETATSGTPDSPTYGQNPVITIAGSSDAVTVTNGTTGQKASVTEYAPGHSR